jgi:hypothetical protein
MCRDSTFLMRSHPIQDSPPQTRPFAVGRISADNFIWRPLAFCLRQLIQLRLKGQNDRWTPPQLAASLPISASARRAMGSDQETLTFQTKRSGPRWFSRKSGSGQSRWFDPLAIASALSRSTDILGLPMRWWVSRTFYRARVRDPLAIPTPFPHRAAPASDRRSRHRRPRRSRPSSAPRSPQPGETGPWSRSPLRAAPPWPADR